MEAESKNILVLAPHTDDGEFGCGASMAKWIEQGYRLIYVAFSACRTVVPESLPPDTLVREVRQATSIMGIEDLLLFDYEVRVFSSKRQEILDDMVKLAREYKPSLVLTPASTDIHQDHGVIHAESQRAFKYNRLLGYELPWNTTVMTTSCFSAVEEKHILKKTEAILSYRSQAFRHYYSAEFIRSLAYTRGTQAGTQFAEAFEVIRWLL
ncbi:MAG TPA: PIG-L family deacetylase [Bacteroidales bacterium]|nr:PIG-L family deacetylase [Bacteroidales bacterium]